MKSDSMSVKARLSIAFGILILLIISISTASIWFLRDADARMNVYIHGITARTMMVEELHGAVDKRSLAISNLLLTQKDDQQEHYKEIVRTSTLKIENTVEELRSTIRDGESISKQAKVLITEVIDAQQSHELIAKQLADFAFTGQQSRAIALMDSAGVQGMQNVTKAADAYIAYQVTRGKEQAQYADDQYKFQSYLLIAGAIAAVVAAIIAASVITNQLTRSLGAEPHELMQAAKNIEDGDLNAIKGSGFMVGSVMESMRNMQTGLAIIVNQVRESSDSISTGSSEISMGYTDLSHRTEEQAANLQRTAASMEQLSSTVSINANSAKQAAKIVEKSVEVAKDSGLSVESLVSTMTEIHDVSKRISDIISIIDGIAFQTNILALNAAVEAARAGDHGKGFAVVASEVRNLAGTSAEASREIKSLITASVEKVEIGVDNASEAGKKVVEVINNIQGVNALVSDISRNASEQAHAIAEVENAMLSLDEVTQQNAALVEQGAAASESLRSQAGNLTSVVGIFKS